MFPEFKAVFFALSTSCLCLCTFNLLFLCCCHSFVPLSSLILAVHSFLSYSALGVRCMCTYTSRIRLMRWFSYICPDFVIVDLFTLVCLVASATCVTSVSSITTVTDVFTLKQFWGGKLAIRKYGKVPVCCAFSQTR
jgi:hypothetical protein